MPEITRHDIPFLGCCYGIGVLALYRGGEFLQPLLARGELGSLVSAGTLPLLYLAVGLKVGAELAGLLARLAEPGPAAGEESA